MKKIEPIIIWKNGINLSGITLNMFITNDNLIDSATFYYEILNLNNDIVSGGNLTINGQEYIDWGNNVNVNQGAYEWAASKLNLVLKQDE